MTLELISNIGPKSALIAPGPLVPSSLSKKNRTTAQTVHCSWANMLSDINFHLHSAPTKF